MAPPRNAFSKWSQYLAARCADAAVSMFPVRANLRTATLIGKAMHRIDKRHRQRTLQHLAVAFPDMSDADRADLALQSFEHLVQLAVEVTASPRYLHPASWSQHTRLVRLGPVLELLSAGKPTILVTGHLGNWEVLGTLMAVLGFPSHAIARPLDNPLINQWLMGLREKRGLTIITKWNATDRMVSVLNSGGSLGFIADQNAGDRGMFVPFFGRLASTYKSIGLLAMSQNAPIICGYARRIGPGFRFEMGFEDIIRPEEWADQPDPLYYITARYVRAIEMMVRQRPEQYLWMHRRWKSRPRYERRGEPMPDGLREQLEALPWMDQATMHGLTLAPP